MVSRVGLGIAADYLFLYVVCPGFCGKYPSINGPVLGSGSPGDWNHQHGDGYLYCHADDSYRCFRECGICVYHYLACGLSVYFMWRHGGGNVPSHYILLPARYGEKEAIHVHISRDCRHLHWPCHSDATAFPRYPGGYCLRSYYGILFILRIVSKASFPFDPVGFEGE